MNADIRIISERLLHKAEQKLQNVDVGHDIWHVRRVLNNALKIHSVEGGNETIIILSCILHDVVDDKYFDVKESIEVVHSWLKDENRTRSEIENVLHIIQNMSYSKELDGAKKETIEFKIVQDADRLDAIGAYGVARAFSYGNQYKRPFFDPTIMPVDPVSKEEYRSVQSPTINHFFEKLLKLKELMKTDTGRQLAIQRTDFLKIFLVQFFEESRFHSEAEKSQWLDLLSD